VVSKYKNNNSLCSFKCNCISPENNYKVGMDTHKEATTELTNEIQNKEFYYVTVIKNDMNSVFSITTLLEQCRCNQKQNDKENKHLHAKTGTRQQLGNNNLNWCQLNDHDAGHIQLLPLSSIPFFKCLPITYNRPALIVYRTEDTLRPELK
jgi:hypothetical protein